MTLQSLNVSVFLNFTEILNIFLVKNIEVGVEIRASALQLVGLIQFSPSNGGIDIICTVCLTVFGLFVLTVMLRNVPPTTLI